MREPDEDHLRETPIRSGDTVIIIMKRLFLDCRAYISEKAYLQQTATASKVEPRRSALTLPDGSVRVFLVIMHVNAPRLRGSIRVST